MGRKKGFKLSAKQKAKMQEGRRKAKEKAMEGMIPGQEKPKRVSRRETREHFPEPVIIGYTRDKGDSWAYPVFSSERKTFKGRLFKTAQEAREAKL